MANTQETIVDIIAAMRDEGHTGESSCLEWVGTKMRYYADRLEAAWKREKNAIEANALAVGGMVEASRATAEKSSVVGSAAKLREALKSIASNLEHRLFARYPRSASDEWMYQKAKAALAEPPRNCEVGTAEEQAQRFRAVCESVKPAKPHYAETGEILCPSIGSGQECKLGICNFGQCALKWSQMPYEEGGEK